MKILLLILASLSLACDNPFRLVYTNDGQLCRQQDSLIKVYKDGGAIDKKMLRDLKINWWVKTAEKAAPGNLIIRQYCLIDLFENSPDHRKQITRLVDILSGGEGAMRTWAESYTYWKYTQDIFYVWLNKFGDSTLASISRRIESGFALTAYQRGLVWYPAPFGDLWDVPLDSMGQELANQMCRPYERVYVKNINRDLVNGEIVYDIDPMPMGLNGHCEKARNQYKIVYGIPEGFHYYEGYDKKYKNQEAEWTDLLDPRRLFTIPFIW